MGDGQGILGVIVLGLGIWVEGIVQDNSKLMSNKFGGSPAGTGHRLIVPNICDDFQFLHFFSTDATIIIQGGAAFREWNGFEEI